MPNFFALIGPIIRKKAISGFAILHMLLAPAVALAADIRFCGSEWPPYLIFEDGAPAGITVEIAHEAGRRAGVQVIVDELPWNRCLQMVRTGKYDGVLDAAERAEFLQGPVSFSAYTNTFWVHSGSQLSRFEPAALAGKTIGLVDGYKYPEDITEMLEREMVTIDYAVDDATNIHKLAFGRVDAIIADLASTLSIARQMGLSIRPLDPTHSSDRLYISFNPDRTAEHALINGTLSEMLRDGFIEKTYQKYLGAGLKDLGLD